MRALIEINCESEEELLSHLSVIRIQVKRAFRKHLKNDPEYMEEPSFELKDSNCYGDHRVIIGEDGYLDGEEGYEQKFNYREEHY